MLMSTNVCAEKFDILFRPPGGPCGCWPPTPWKHYVLRDPYERVNVWSHGLPGLLFLLLGVASYSGLYEDASREWVHNPLGIFCFCAATTHLGSMMTHIYPDSFALEKLDHLGIVALIIGTPLTALMAYQHGEVPLDVKVILAAMLAAAFLEPAPRVAAFTAGTVAAVALHGRELLNWNLGVQLALYTAAAVFFLRSKLWEPNLKRWQGFYDHHLLHYVVTAASTLHLFYILAGTNDNGRQFN